MGAEGWIQAMSTPETLTDFISNMRPQYLHCPKCGELDRHFTTENTRRLPCQKCWEYHPASDFKEPEISDEWIPLIRCGTEISIVQKKDLHGRISAGWFSETKILIADTKARGGECEACPVFDEIVALAHKEAKRRNALQNP